MANVKFLHNYFICTIYLNWVSDLSELFVFFTSYIDDHNQNNILGQTEQLRLSMVMVIDNLQDWKLRQKSFNLEYT